MITPIVHRMVGIAIYTSFFLVIIGLLGYTEYPETGWLVVGGIVLLAAALVLGVLTEIAINVQKMAEKE